MKDQRARELAERERAVTATAQARTRAKHARRAGRPASRPRPPSRPARYGALPRRTVVALAVGWLLAQVLVAVFVDAYDVRLGLAIATAFALPLIVVLAGLSRRP